MDVLLLGLDEEAKRERKTLQNDINLGARARGVIESTMETQDLTLSSVINLNSRVSQARIENSDFMGFAYEGKVLSHHHPYNTDTEGVKEWKEARTEEVSLNKVQYGDNLHPNRVKNIGTMGTVDGATFSDTIAVNQGGYSIGEYEIKYKGLEIRMSVYNDGANVKSTEYKLLVGHDVQRPGDVISIPFAESGISSANVPHADNLVVTVTSVISSHDDGKVSYLSTFSHEKPGILDHDDVESGDVLDYVIIVDNRPAQPVHETMVVNGLTVARNTRVDQYISDDLKHMVIGVQIVNGAYVSHRILDGGYGYKLGESVRLRRREITLDSETNTITIDVTELAHTGYTDARCYPMDIHTPIVTDNGRYVASSSYIHDVPETEFCRINQIGYETHVSTKVMEEREENKRKIAHGPYGSRDHIQIRPSVKNNHWYDFIVGEVKTETYTVLGG
jgi:hypothetical protein